MDDNQFWRSLADMERGQFVVIPWCGANPEDMNTRAHSEARKLGISINTAATNTGLRVDVVKTAQAAAAPESGAATDCDVAEIKDNGMAAHYASFRKK